MAIDPDNPAHVSDLVERLGDELRAVIKKAAHDFDPMAVSALRIGHAVLIAVQRNDREALDALRAWEDQTLDYMQIRAFDEYLTMPLPPRPPRPGRIKGEAHDRHLIVDALKERIALYLKQRGREPRLPSSGTLDDLLNKNEDAQNLLPMVHRCFPNLKPVDRFTRKMFSRKILDHRAKGRPLEPEDIIKYALLALGMPPSEVNSTLKGADKSGRAPHP